MAFLYPWNGSSVAIRTPVRKSSPRSASQFSCAVPDLPETRSTQAGRGMILPACQVYDAGEFTWAPAASVLVVHYVFIALSTRTPAKRAGSSDAACRHGLIWDHTVFHVVPNWRASPDIVAPSKRNCRIAQRIARTPKHALGAHRVVLLSESPDLAGVFAAYPAPYCAIRSTPGPRPRARRSPPPPHARDLERFSPQPGQPAQRSQDSTSSTRPHSRRAAATRWKPSKSTSRSHRSQRPSDTEQQQVG